jgi:hypothetical protein
MDNADKKLSVQFFLHPRENHRKSKEAGRPIFDEIEMVSIASPGNTKTEFTARADRMHYDSNTEQQWAYKDRFADAYAAFKRGVEEHMNGTPISAAPFLPIGIKSELAAKKVRTVEQLAGMADRDIRKMGMGFRQHVDAAKAYIDTASGTASLAKEMAELRRQNEELLKRMGAVEAAPSAVEKDEVQDQFSTMDDEDLQNILTDAGVTVDKRWGRKKLLSEIRAVAAAKETEAA